MMSDKQNKGFTQVPNSIINDDRLYLCSFKLLVVMMHYPSDFVFNKRMLQGKMGWGDKLFQKAWSQLQDLEYVVKECRREGGTYNYSYTLRTQPSTSDRTSQHRAPYHRAPHNGVPCKGEHNNTELKQYVINNNNKNNNTVSSNNNIDKKEKNVKKEKSEYDTSQCPFVKQPEPIKYYDINTLKRLNNRRLVQQEIQKCIKDDNKNTEFYLQLIDLIKNMEVDHASSTNQPIREYQH